MSAGDVLAAGAAVLVLAYYMSAWWLVGRDPKLGTVVTRYEAPHNLSPAMLRYVWKQTFDDRVFWAALLSLVAKKAIRVSHDEGVIRIHPEQEHRTTALAQEEWRLLWDLTGGKRRKAVKLTLLSNPAATAIANLADSLQNRALGRWVKENRRYALTGATLSAIPVILAALPNSVDQWVALIIEFAVMVPAAFYGMFLALRIRDLIRVTRGNPLRLPGRTFQLFGFFVSCVIAIIFGFGMLAATFGLFTFVVAMMMVLTTLLFTHLLKAPTVEGTKLLVDIEGFRDFLSSVERLSLDRDEAPESEISRYERYLPYAVALEVEQAWSDKLVALGSTPLESWSELHATCYYLGIWQGQPIDIVVGPPPRR